MHTFKVKMRFLMLLHTSLFTFKPVQNLQKLVNICQSRSQI